MVLAVAPSALLLLVLPFRVRELLNRDRKVEGGLGIGGLGGNKLVGCLYFYLLDIPIFY